MNIKNIVENISNGALDATFERLYGKAAIPSQKDRFLNALSRFSTLYGCEREVSLFSIPGRTEISGNHTDHNRGCVIAGSVDLDIIAVAAKRDDNIIKIKSEGHREDVVDTDRFTTPDPSLFGKSSAIIAGVCVGLKNAGYAIGGFDAYTSSCVPGGSGLSSSAAFENTVGTIISHFYNDAKVSPVEIAKISQFSENEFFGKPCGLMDQVACAYGGIVAIDFADPKSPVIEQLGFDLRGAGYSLCIIKTGGNHADLTDDYAAVPSEMKAVAKELGVEYLRQTDKETLRRAIPSLRKTVGDRAILRACHFFDENERVAKLKAALKEKDLDAFFDGILASGRSSFCYLQNVFTTKNVSEQGVSLALCIAEDFLKNNGGAWRVHGGGFAGTVQSFVPSDKVSDFSNAIEGVFGEGSCLVLSIRPDGAIKLV